MPEEWTGNLIGRMHNYRITRTELAKEVHTTKAYVSMILNGQRKGANMKERLEAAAEAIIQRRKEST